LIGTPGVGPPGLHVRRSNSGREQVVMHKWLGVLLGWLSVDINLRLKGVIGLALGSAILYLIVMRLAG
jgi:hypothetical protein